MYIIEAISINPMAVKLTLAMIGFVFTSLCIAMTMYYKSFKNNGELFEAEVVKIKETQYYSKNSIQVVPIA